MVDKVNLPVAGSVVAAVAGGIYKNEFLRTVLFAMFANAVGEGFSSRYTNNETIWRKPQGQEQYEDTKIKAWKVAVRYSTISTAVWSSIFALTTIEVKGEKAISAKALAPLMALAVAISTLVGMRAYKRGTDDVISSSELKVSLRSRMNDRIVKGTKAIWIINTFVFSFVALNLQIRRL